MAQKVSFIYSPNYLDASNSLPKVKGRADLVNGLIQAYDLMRYTTVLAPHEASREQVLGFHSAAYIDALESLCCSADPEEPSSALAAEQYGFCYDCPVESGTYNAARWICGGTIAAADALVTGCADVSINWCGGWHHAKRDEAAGFCYMNDVVLGILELLQKFDRVLYIDLDLHHGDGVEDAFSSTRKVFTLSLHKYAPGFFPGTGSLDDVGFGKAKYYTCNLPLKDGVRDELYCASFVRLAEAVRSAYAPLAVVCQCGADGLTGDPAMSFNLSSAALRKCVGHVLGWELPTILLGGGGYNFENTSRCWTNLTALCLGRELSSDIPEHKYFTRYGPDFELGLLPGNRPDTNKSSEVDKMLTTIQRNLVSVQATTI